MLTRPTASLSDDASDTVGLVGAEVCAAEHPESSRATATSGTRIRLMSLRVILKRIQTVASPGFSSFRAVGKDENPGLA
jgi:hypothetical protein